jgi:hypothetical protein
MSDRRTRLPELLLARLSVGVVPVDGIYWYERQTRSWIDRSRELQTLRADASTDRRRHYPDTD